MASILPTQQVTTALGGHITPTIFDRSALTLNTPELVAHGKTRQEIASLLDADEVIYQDLDDLKAACTEAAGGESEVTDFEAGVFCGKYKTAVPGGYFEHLSRLQRNKKWKNAPVADEEGENSPIRIANGGPVNVAYPHKALDVGGANGAKHPED